MITSFMINRFNIVLSSSPVKHDYFLNAQIYRRRHVERLVVYQTAQSLSLSLSPRSLSPRSLSLPSLSPRSLSLSSLSLSLSSLSLLTLSLSRSLLALSLSLLAL